MVKRIAKYGFKSGILPKTRQILPKMKTSWEIEEEKKTNVGFVDPKMAPKGSHPNPPPRHFPTAEEKIANSAKEPSNSNKKTRTVQQEARALSAAMRRRYLTDSLRTQEVIDRKRLERREQKFEEARQKRLEVQEHQVSKATQLTLPTIESFLNEPFVQRRTLEEQTELQLKREANRNITSIKATENKLNRVLELYQKSDEFIVTEEELNAKIDSVFATDKHQNDLHAILYSGNAFSNGVSAENKRVKELLEKLSGSSSVSEPGLAEVQDALSGETQRWLEEMRSDKQN